MKIQLNPSLPGNANPFRPTSDQNSKTDSRGTESSLTLLHIREILVPIDFSEHSNLVLKYALAFAGQFDAAITLLNVIEPPLVNPDAILYAANPDQISQALENLLSRVCEQEKLKPPIKQQTVVKSGVPYDKIVETAKNQKADLMVIATHGRTGLAHALLGSTAEKVIRHAPCPVLVVHWHKGDPESNLKTN